MSLAEQKALQSLAVISSEVDALAAQVEVVVKSAAIGITPVQQQITLLHELLTQTLLKLDLVSGDGEIRVQRKAQVVRANGLSSQLDRAVQGPGTSVPPPAVAPTTAAAHVDFQKEASSEPATQAVSTPIPSGQEAGAQPSGEHQPPPPPPTLPAPSIPVPETGRPPQPAPSRAPVPAPPLPSTPAASPTPSPASSAAPFVAQVSSHPQAASNPPLQKLPTRVGSPAGSPAMAPVPPRQPGEDGRKKAAGMMSHALSLNDGLSTTKPPPLQTRPSLASSATAAFVAPKQPPKSAPSSAPITPPSSAPGAPLAPSLLDRLDDVRLAATPPPVAHSSSIHDLDSFFGGGPAMAPPPAVVTPPGAPAAQPSFANFEGASQAQQAAGAPAGAPSPPAPGPAQAPVPVLYPSPTGPRLSFASPPKPAGPQPAPVGQAAMGGLSGFAPPPARRSSSSSVAPPAGPPSYKASSPSLPISPQEGPRPQRRSESVPVLGNLSGFASPVPPPKPVLKETDPSPVTSPVVSSFSPPLAALSSFGTDLPSPATRSSLARPLTSAAPGPAIPPPPAPGVRSSLQAMSIEEALRGALSRRESASRPPPPSSEPGRPEPAPAHKMEARSEASGQAGPAAAPPAGAPTPPVQTAPAAADASSWVAFDSDFDPRAFSGSTKSSPSTSRRSSYDLPPPPRPAQPLFPEAAPTGSPAEQGPAATPAPLLSLLDGPPAPGQAALPPPADLAAVPTQGSPPRSQAPPPSQPAVVAVPQQASAGPQPAFAAAFPAAVSAHQPPGSSQGSSSAQQGASPQAAPRSGAPAGGPSWGDPFAQPGPPQQNGGQHVPGPQQIADRGLAQQRVAQQEGVWGGAALGVTSPGSQPASGSSQAGLAAGNSQGRPPATAPAGVVGSGPLEGFGETGPRPALQAAGRGAYGAGWPQHGPAGYYGPSFAGAGAQGFGPGGRAPGYGPAPGMAPSFSGGPPQQGLPYQYAAPGQAPWLQQAGPAATPGAGYGGFGGQAGFPGGAAGQPWPYQQRPGAGGQLPYQAQAAYAGGGSPFPPSAQQAPATSLQPQSNNVGFGYQGGYPGVSAAGPAWPSNGGPGSVGTGTQAPAILPPWMIQPQQPASSGAGSQGQGWGT